MEEIVFKGKMIEVIHTPSPHGGKIFEYARRSPGVRLIIPKGDMIVMTKEMRHELGIVDFRLPGGKVFDTLEEYASAQESGIDIADAAKMAAVKEAKEEVGIDVTELSLVHKSICGATVVWDLYFFIVKNYSESAQSLEEGEDITVAYVSREEAKTMCLDGKMHDERSALVLMRYLSNTL